MRRIFRLFLSEKVASSYILVLCLLLAGLAEAFSIGSLLPAITAIAGGETSGSSSLNNQIKALVAQLNIAPTVGNLILIVVALMIVKAALSFAALSYAGISAARVSTAIRLRLIEAVFRARWPFLATQRGGQFANAISNDAGRAGDAYLLSAQLIAYAIQALAYTAVAIAIDWKLAALGIAAGLLVSYSMSGLIRLSRRAGYKQTDRTSALTVHMVDMLANLKPIKAMQRHEPALATIKHSLWRLKRALITRELAKSGLVQASDTVVVVLIGAGAYLAHAVWHTPLPELIVSGVVFFQIISIASKMQRYLQQSVQVESAYVRTKELIEHTDANSEINDGKIEPTLRKSCQFRKVDFAHGKTAVISDATFTIPAQAITVLSGPSGAGKTTIVDLLIGLNRPDRGQILVDTTPLDQIDLFAWRKMIGYVPQELNLFHASIRENITLDDSAITDDEVLFALALAGAGDFIASLPQGLDTDVGEMGGKLSGGQRQRISLARALVTKPQVLILDEVTSALDPATEAEIVAKIESLRGSYTIIVITHRPAWTAIADRLYRVSHGKVTPQDPPARRKPARRNNLKASRTAS